jgi:hypothetical protein
MKGPALISVVLERRENLLPLGDTVDTYLRTKFVFVAHFRDESCLLPPETTVDTCLTTIFMFVALLRDESWLESRRTSCSPSCLTYWPRYAGSEPASPAQH